MSDDETKYSAVFNGAAIAFCLMLSCFFTVDSASAKQITSPCDEFPLTQQEVETLNTAFPKTYQEAVHGEEVISENWWCSLQHISEKEYSLEELPEPIYRLNNLAALEITSSALRVLGVRISDLKNLRKISISAPVERIDFSPSELPLLAFLSINRASVNHFKPGFFDSQSLVTLSVSTTPHYIGDIAAKTENLERVVLNINGLSSFPDLESDKLRSIAIYEANFSSIPEEIARHSSLSEIIVFDTPLTSLPQSLTGMHKLTRLVVTGSELAYIPEFVATIPNIHVLNINGRKIVPRPWWIDYAPIFIRESLRQYVTGVPRAICDKYKQVNTYNHELYC